MGEDDSGKVGGEGGVFESVADPSSGIAGFVAAEKWRGKDDGGFENDGFWRKEDVKIGGELLLLAKEKLLLPDAAWAAVVVVSRNDENRYF